MEFIKVTEQREPGVALVELNRPKELNALNRQLMVELLEALQALDKNPEVKVGVVDITTKQTRWADFNEKDDQYFGTPFWTPDGSSLWLQWMNRQQNHSIK